MAEKFYPDKPDQPHTASKRPFREAVARADELGKIAREAAEQSIRISQEALSKAKEISNRAKLSVAMKKVNSEDV